MAETDVTQTCFFWFLFEGARNNYIIAEKEKPHSNVARLYDCYPGLSVPGVLPVTIDWKTNEFEYKHFIKAYILGVGTAFKHVNDSGEGGDKMDGAATGYEGEDRILWALLQAISNIHRYFMNMPLLSDDQIKSLLLKNQFNKQHWNKVLPLMLFQPPMPNAMCPLTIMGTAHLQVCGPASLRTCHHKCDRRWRR